MGRMLSPSRASRTSSSSVNAPSGPPEPILLGVIIGLTITASPIAIPSTSRPTSITSPAPSWPSGVTLRGLGMPPILI